MKLFEPRWPRFGHILAIDKITHHAHLVLPVVGMSIALYEYLSTWTLQVGPVPHSLILTVGSLKDLHLGWEMLFGLLLVVVGIGNHFVAEWLLRCRQSALIPGWGLPNAKGDDFTNSHDLVVRGIEATEVEAVSSFLNNAFPAKWFAGRRPGDRITMLERLVGACPSSIRVMLLNDSMVGCSVLAPMKESSYFQYRNGHSDPFLFQDSDFSETSHLLISLYCFGYQMKGRVAGLYLRDLFIGHTADLAEVSGERVCVLGPRKSPSGAANMKTLGALLCGTSLNDFPLYELDLRRPGELSARARQTLEQIEAAQRRVVSRSETAGR
jgi:hypothetical protein